MPSGSDFKYSTGDTTAWKSKYYAFVDFALSMGASVADIEAFLAENSSFSPGTAPTALASLNAVTATTSDNLEYQIIHGTPYASLTANLWFLVRMPSANAGAMTLKVDDLAAKPVRIGGVATAGGEFAAGVVYLLTYDAGNDRFDAIGPSSGTKTLAAKDADYTLQAGDLGGLTVVPIDIDGQDVDVKELPLGSMKGVVRYVVSHWDGVGDTYQARVIDASDTEVATLYAEGDFVDIAYDGATRTLGPERVTVEGYVPLTANHNVNNGAALEEKVWTANLSVDKNIGGFGDFVTNFRIDALFDCVLHVRVKKVEDKSYSSHLWMQLRVNGAEIDDDGEYGNKGDGFEDDRFDWILDLSGGDYVEVYGRNHDTADDARLMGNVNKNQSKLWWWLERRRR